MVARDWELVDLTMSSTESFDSSSPSAESFFKSLVKLGFLKIIMTILQEHDGNTQYWAVQIAHRLVLDSGRC